MNCWLKSRITDFSKFSQPDDYHFRVNLNFAEFNGTKHALNYKIVYILLYWPFMRIIMIKILNAEHFLLKFKMAAILEIYDCWPLCYA